MMKSNWKIFTDTIKPIAADKILKRIKNSIGISDLLDLRTEKYHKDNTILFYFNIEHDFNSKADTLYEILVLADRIGRCWQLFGSIEVQPEGYSTESSISGVVTMQWWIDWPIR